MRGFFNFFSLFLLNSLLSWKVWGLENCTLRLVLNDNGGDGFNHNYISLLSNQQDVTMMDADGAHSLTATLNFGSQTQYTFSVANGSTVSVWYHAAGKYPTENLWQIQHQEAQSNILHQGTGTSSDVRGDFTVQCCCTPPQPTGVEIDINSDVPYYATLTWDAVDGAISYLVSRQMGDGNFTSFGEYTQTSVMLTLDSDTTYRFTVTAVSSYAHGMASEAVSVTTAVFDTCEINLLQFDNLDDVTDRYSAYLSVTVGDGVALYSPFDQKSKTTSLQLPVAGGEMSITSLLISSRDTSVLEFEYALGATIFYHQGGGFVTTSNSFALSCEGIASGTDHLLANKKEQHLLAQQPFEYNISMHGPSGLRKEALQQAAYCQFALIMFDSSGNGWTGMYLSIYLNGAQWASPLYVPSNLSSYTWYFWLNAGTRAQVLYIASNPQNPSSASYVVQAWDGANLGAVIVSSGQGGTEMSNTSWTACSASPTTTTTTTRPASSTTTTTTTTRTPSTTTTTRTPSTTTTTRTPSTTTTTTRAPTTTTPAPTQACPSQSTCAARFRNNCASNFNPPTCGTCLSGYQANDGTTNSRSNSQCTLIPTCPANTTCASLLRNSCQSNFNPPTCGVCLTGYTASDGNSNSNSQCTDINECTLGTDSCDPNAQCTNTPGTYTCTCNSGFTGNGFTCTQQGCGQRIRREWFSISVQTRDQYVRAVLQLYKAGQYFQFANYHQQWAPYAHGTAAFLPWHRVFLQWFEDTVRGLGGEFTCFTLPYWDWTNSQNIPLIFTNAITSAGYRQGLGVKDGRCFGTGNPFSGFTYEGTCVSRSAYTTPSSLPSPVTVANQLQTTLYSTMRPRVETYHNSLHIWVGNTMNQVPQSPADPIFFVHHTFVDQIWATWQTCEGYANIVTQPANINVVYESGNSWTANLPGWSQSPQQVWNLIGTFNVRYERTWFNEAFAGLSAATCPASNQQFLFATTSEDDGPAGGASSAHSSQHLLSAPSSSLYTNTNTNSSTGKKKYHKNFNAFRPTQVYLSQQQAVYETFKDTYLETQNVTVALDKAFVHSCLLGPTLTLQSAQLFTPEFIVMMDFQEECAAGLCVNPCWTRLFNSSL